MINAKEIADNRIASPLEKSEIETSCPVHYVPIKHLRKRKFEPFFHTLLSPKLNKSDSFVFLKYKNISNVLCWKEPSIFQYNGIKAIKGFTQICLHVRLEKLSVDSNETIRIINSPGDLINGMISLTRYNPVKVNLPSHGYRMEGEIERKSFRGKEVPVFKKKMYHKRINDFACWETNYSV